MKTTQAVAMDEHHVRLESSGDFDFIDERYDDVDDEDDDEDDYYDEDEYEEFSGSGEGGWCLKYIQCSLNSTLILFIYFNCNFFFSQRQLKSLNDHLRHQCR